jgi:hypothetical protein
MDDGTFQPMLLAQAFHQGLQVCVPEVWGPFLERISCDVAQFRQVAAMPPYNDHRAHLAQFALNPLQRFPLLNIGEQKYIAVDPELIVDRVTLGLFYDLFDAGEFAFTERFAHALETFIGQLLQSVGPGDCHWSEADVRQAARRWRPPSQNADRA